MTQATRVVVSLSTVIIVISWFGFMYGVSFLDTLNMGFVVYAIIHGSFKQNL